LTTWKASRTAVASSSSSRIAFAVAAERVQRCGADAGGEGGAAGLEPVGVDLPGPAQDQVEQPGPGLSVVPGQVHHAGHLLGRLGLPRPVMPQVLIDPDRLDAGESGRVIGQLLEQWLDRLPHGVPVHPEPAGDRGDRRGVTGDGAERPPRRACGQLAPGTGQVVAFAEPGRRAGGLGAAVAALAPHQLDRGAERGDVVQQPRPPPTALRDHPAAWAAGLDRRGLDGQPQPGRAPPAVVSPDHREHVHAGQVEQGVDACAVPVGVHAARRRLSHRRGLSVGQLGRYRS
jgi:hypothetical protein